MEYWSNDSHALKSEERLTGLVGGCGEGHLSGIPFGLNVIFVRRILVIVMCSWDKLNRIEIKLTNLNLSLIVIIVLTRY